jgi:hydrogenase maturation factor
VSSVARTSIAEQATVGRNVARTSLAEPAEQETVGRNTCLTCGDVAIPMRVVRTGDDGLADCVTEDGRTSQVELALVDAGPGDEVLVHACVAIQLLEPAA